MSSANRFTAASNLNVSYFLVKTPDAVERLNNASEAHFLWSINGWSLFMRAPAALAAAPSVSSLPVITCLPARWKNRGADELDLFNLGEQLAFAGHPEVLPVWASSQDVAVGDQIDRLQNASWLSIPHQFRRIGQSGSAHWPKPRESCACSC